MFYLKVPVRFLCRPEELKYGEGTEERMKIHEEKKADIRRVLADYRIPGWAFSVYDLEKAEIIEEA